MGLNHWVESDGAADFRYALIQSMLKMCKDEAVRKTNEYNTDGCINVALLLEDGTFDFLEGYDFEKFGPVFDETNDQLERKIEDGEEYILACTGFNAAPIMSTDSACEQLENLKRLKSSVEEFLKEKNAKDYYDYEEMEVVDEKVD